MSRRAYRGPNGWYVAEVDDTGTHYQPADGGRYESRAAALAADSAADGERVDHDGTIYDRDTGEVIGHAEDAQ